MRAYLARTPRATDGLLLQTAFSKFVLLGDELNQAIELVMKTLDVRHGD